MLIEVRQPGTQSPGRRIVWQFGGARPADIVVGPEDAIAIVVSASDAESGIRRLLLDATARCGPRNPVDLDVSGIFLGRADDPQRTALLGRTYDFDAPGIARILADGKCRFGSPEDPIVITIELDAVTTNWSGDQVSLTRGVEGRLLIVALYPK